MAYYDTVEELKKALSGYSSDTEKLKSLYKTAVANAEKAYNESKSRLLAENTAARNTVYADTAREERNAMNMLASRGLGFSGEAAQEKLNSNILLSNRLGALDTKLADGISTLEQTANEHRYKLESELAANQAALNDKKAGLLFDIAKTESDREMKDKQLEAEKLMQDKEIASERELLQKKLEAERLLEEARLANDRKMQREELAAKYPNGSQNSSSSSTVIGSGSPDGNASLDELLKAFIPGTDPKDLAKLMVNNISKTGYIYGDEDEYLINRYLLDMTDNYGIDKDYYNELVFMLKAYGYEDISQAERLALVVGYDSKSYRQDKYEELQELYVKSGMNAAGARAAALQYSSVAQLDYIFSRVDTKSDFLAACKKAGIEDKTANSYADKAFAKKEKEESEKDDKKDTAGPDKQFSESLLK